MRSCALLLFLATGALAGAAPTDNGPWMRALSNSFIIQDVQRADLNGDGKTETIVCYQDPPEISRRGGGVAILSADGRSSLFHARFDRVWCDKTQAKGRALTLELKSDLPGRSTGRLVWQHGRDFGFPNNAQHPLRGATFASSSNLQGHAPKDAFDGDLTTAWAEGEAGTGIGETVEVKFREPMDVGYLAVFGGRAESARSFADYNRLHRGSIDTRTRDDLGDDAAGLDFEALGLGVIGDRKEFSVDDAPEVTFVRVDKRDVRELELRLDSVYLGNKYDDTQIAEIDIIPTLRLNETLDRSAPLQTTKVPAQPANEKSKATAVPDKKVTIEPTKSELDKLDHEPSSLIPDSDF